MKRLFFNWPDVNLDYILRFKKRNLVISCNFSPVTFQPTRNHGTWHIPGIHNFSWTCLRWLFPFYHEIHHHLEYLTYIESFPTMEQPEVFQSMFLLVGPNIPLVSWKEPSIRLCIHLVLNCSTVAIWKHVVSCWLKWFRCVDANLDSLPDEMTIPYKYPMIPTYASQMINFSSLV